MKHKIFTFFLALIASIGTIFAESGTCGENLTWNLTDGVLTISGTGEMTNYEDYYNPAPWYRPSITSVIIEDGVTSIGDWAFYKCRSLTSVTIPNSVTSIGSNAFYYCTSLTSVTIPNSVTSIGDEAFADCTGLTSVTIPNSVTSIGNEAFYSCSSLTSVTIGNSVTSIGESAFEDCSSLTSVTIPNSVTSIGGSAFYECSGLTSVTIGSSVTSIGNGAFSGCSSLPVIDNLRYADTYLVEAVDKSLTSYQIKEETKWIGSSAFSGCSSLTSVTIPNSVTSIGVSVFDHCSSLTSITIPNSVTRIGKGAFYYCTSLTSITCEAATPPTCGDYVFDGVDKSIPLYVPAGSVATYKAAYVWKRFGDNIQPIQAPEADVTDLEANPTDNAVVIAWPAVTGATVYTINIYKGSDLICTLSFNELGQLLSISLVKKANGGNPKTAVQTATGWQYTIDGLEAGTAYSYTVIAKNGDETLYSKTSNFTTTNGTAVDQIDANPSTLSVKRFINGQLFIIRDGKTYSVQGAEVQ